jgi:hypothetical protein
MKCWPWAHRWENWRVIAEKQVTTPISVEAMQKAVAGEIAPLRHTRIEQRSDCEICGMIRLRSVEA